MSYMETGGERRYIGPRIEHFGSTPLARIDQSSIDLAACVMAIHQNTVPPSVNTDALDSDCRFRFVQDDPIDAKVNCAVSSGYAMAGGQCAALVIQRYGES